MLPTYELPGLKLGEEVENPQLKYFNLLSFYLFVFHPGQLEYVSDPSQLEFLQLLSDRARQQITYHCKNSVAWPDGSSDDAAKSIKMLTINGLELHAKSSNKFKPKIVGDDCKVRYYKGLITILVTCQLFNHGRTLCYRGHLPRKWLHSKN